MDKENLTQESAAVVAAIIAIQERKGELSPNIGAIRQETGMDIEAIRGTLTDLTKRGIVEIDFCEHRSCICYSMRT